MRRWIARAVLCCAASCALLVSASAQEAATRTRLLTIPDATALADHFPPVSLANGVSGRVVLECQVAADGNSECTAAEETPAGAGFGAAATALAQDWRFEPRMESGAAVASVSRIPIVFQNPNTDASVIEGALTVDGVRGVAPTETAADESRWNAELLEISACRWAGRPDCRVFRGSREFYKNADYYPLPAHAAGIEGRALVACAVRSDRSSNCALEDEAPRGSGFGERAIQLVSDVLVEQRGQVEPGAVIRVPVEFTMNPAGGYTQRSDWSERPTAMDFNRFFPSRALERDVQGSVDLICQIRTDRRVSCIVALERPTRYGFGDAALRMSGSFLLREDLLGLPGLAIGDRIKLPISFLLG